ncbi:ER membrane protein complex subunit 1 isoform X2 [Teleopsis dalmanni]|uniref:ER membrane protein complex subunit 1 isoform X2 n=1 Tax=Teleopsis dalmanni TaxID=139649 RepID=UPI0018CE9852|nr:ER membrane protein complex subunit 1 isoform X2 [Teleopsis dalmanni]
MTMKCILLVAVVAAVLLNLTTALYEDQIKKFDWRSINIGALESAHLDLNSFQPRLLVTTRENVVASLCPKTGEILWRQVLEKLPRGSLKLLQVTAASGDSSNTAAARANSNHGFDMLTVQGHAPAIVRGWNANSAHLEWEWSLMPLQPDRAETAYWFYQKALLYHVVPVWNSHLEVTQYFATSGHPTGTTNKISAAWITKEQCTSSGVFYTCTSGDKLISIDLTAAQPKVLTKTLPVQPFSAIQPLKEMNGVYVVDRKLYSVNDEVKICEDLVSNSYAVGTYNKRRVIAQADIVDNFLNIQVNYADNCEKIEELTNRVPYEHNYGVPILSTLDCKLKRQNDGKSCLYILETSADMILAVQQNKIRWSREEALANVVAADFIDLPLTDTEGTLENELKGKSGDILSAFLLRISTQILQIKSIFLHVIGLAPPPSATQKAGLVRDSFGLHKMLVLLTKSGKVFGIDNISGKHHWQQFLPNVGNFENGEKMRLLVQRTSKHFPLQPLCTIVAKEKNTGNGLLFRFNPITGQHAEGGILKLDYKIKQLSLLAETETDYIKGILTISADDGIYVYPESVKNKAHGMYMFTADKNTAVLKGYYITYEQGILKSTTIWNARLGGHNNDHKIIAVATKNPIERVHSQGRVLGDRSVLYKYINPNLVAVVTQAPDSIHKFILNVYLIDVVSGSVVFSLTHRKVRGPLHIIHSENWLAYSYYNDKVRRTEITTMELYEGKTQANSSVWSSLNAPLMPLVERQSYILPTTVEAMQETITERGITSKHVLIGISSGAIVEMPWALLDPRRPISSTTQGREEGAIPYIPELPIPNENMINYNQTIARLNTIYTSPSGLESTCLVAATGLDIFVTRITPSKTFDILKDDFDYILITTVLVALIVGSIVVRQLSSRKLIKQAWK